MVYNKILIGSLYVIYKCINLKHFIFNLKYDLMRAEKIKERRGKRKICKELRFWTTDYKYQHISI